MNDLKLEPDNKEKNEESTVVSNEVVSNEVVSNEVVSNEVVSNELVSNEVVSNEIVSNENFKNSFYMISESGLSEDQKKLASHIYDLTKKSIQSFISDSSFNNAIKITMTIGQVIKQLENVKIDGKAPTGADKKVVAIQLGRILIKEITPDDKEVEIFILYDTIAGPTLEAMIDVSKVVNVQEITKCCPKILDVFKKIF